MLSDIFFWALMTLLVLSVVLIGPTIENRRWAMISQCVILVLSVGTFIGFWTTI